MFNQFCSRSLVVALLLLAGTILAPNRVTAQELDENLYNKPEIQFSEVQSLLDGYLEGQIYLSPDDVLSLMDHEENLNNLHDCIEGCNGDLLCEQLCNNDFKDTSAQIDEDQENGEYDEYE